MCEIDILLYKIVFRIYFLSKVNLKKKKKVEEFYGVFKMLTYYL